jgi:S1-C subfamily serine protease
MSWETDPPRDYTEPLPTVVYPPVSAPTPAGYAPPRYQPASYPLGYAPPAYTPSPYPPAGYLQPGHPGQPPMYPPGYGPGYAPPPPPPPPRRRGLLVGIAVIVVLLLAAGATSFVLVLGAIRRGNETPVAGNTPSGASGPVIPSPVPSTQNPNSTGPLDVNALAAKVNPGVVDINTTLGFANARAAGTGIVLTSTGLVLTNNHVIAGETEISVVDVGNGKTYGATILGYDKDDDIGLIQLTNASGLAVLTPGDSSQVQEGDAILAVGNAGGTGGTPSAAPGTVTALNKTITASDELDGSTNQLEGLIQVAADIQAGDSGGPLVDRSGHVIGIDTAASGGFRVQSAGGQGFAIPINHALDIARQIQNKQASATVHIGSTALLGVQTTTLAGQSGASVVSVIGGGPADTAGLVGGDVIQTLDGKAVDSPTTLGDLINGYHPGDKATIGWIDRNGASKTGSVTFTDGPPA